MHDAWWEIDQEMSMQKKGWKIYGGRREGKGKVKVWESKSKELCGKLKIQKKERNIGREGKAWENKLKESCGELRLEKKERNNGKEGNVLGNVCWQSPKGEGRIIHIGEKKVKKNHVLNWKGKKIGREIIRRAVWGKKNRRESLQTGIE